MPDYHEELRSRIAKSVLWVVANSSIELLDRSTVDALMRELFTRRSALTVELYGGAMALEDDDVAGDVLGDTRQMWCEICSLVQTDYSVGVVVVENRHRNAHWGALAELYPSVEQLIIDRLRSPQPSG